MNTQVKVFRSPTHVALEIVDDIKSNHRGQFFSITYKGYAGEEYTVNGRVLRHKPIKRHISNTYKVYDQKKGKYTSIPFDRVSEYKVAGEHKVVQNQ